MLTRYGERGTSWTRFGVVKDDLSWLLHLCAFPSSMRFITAIFHYIMEMGHILYRYSSSMYRSHVLPLYPCLAHIHCNISLSAVRTIVCACLWVVDQSLLCPTLGIVTGLKLVK